MKYWLRVNGRDYGPLSAEEIIENMEIPLTADALIAKVGDNEWRSIEAALPELWEKARAHRELPPAKREMPLYTQRKAEAAARGAELALEVEAGAIYLAPRRLTIKSIALTAFAGFLSMAFAGILVAVLARLPGGKHPAGFGLAAWIAASVVLASIIEHIYPRRAVIFVSKSDSPPPLQS